MAFNQNEQTIFFVKEVKRLLSEGVVDKKKNLASEIGWTENALSQVLSGYRNIPVLYFNNFKKSYNISIPLDESPINYKEKYIELLEKQLLEKENLLESIKSIQSDIIHLRNEVEFMSSIIKKNYSKPAEV